MKIGIMSDSHENMTKIQKAVDVFNNENIGLFLHAGDIISPITYKEFVHLKSKMFAVFGNNDGEKLMLVEKFKAIAEFSNDYRELLIDNKKIVLMHEPKFIDVLLKNRDYDLVIYGHTHKIDLRKDKTQILNPGECGGLLTGKSTIAICELDTMEIKIIEI